MCKSHIVQSGSASLAVERIGTGHPVVFLHANVADSRMWFAQMDSIGAGNMAIAYDRRGFGKTVTGPEGFSAVSDLMAVIDAISDGSPTILVGCSRGGRIAIDAALQHPERFRALALIAPSVTGSPAAINSPEIEELMRHASKIEETGDLDQLNAIKARIWLDGPLGAPGRVQSDARRLFLDMNGIALRRKADTEAEIDAPPAYHRLSDISMPTLVISGDLDFPFIQERSRHIAKTVHNGSHHEVPGTAHLPSLERPTEITELLAGFVSANRT
tara:strand:+ start:78 stop:896 length:819 start_codon:yes stop_codon:yes gene_type:complete